jgi:hypothetical protein
MASTAYDSKSGTISIERIRPPKWEQVQFLSLSLGLHCIAGCMLHGPVNPTRGKKEADSSKMLCIFNTHLPFDGAYCSCIAAVQQPRLRNKN